MGIPGAGRVLLNAKNGKGLFIGNETGGIEGVDRHVEKQDVLHLLTKAAEMRAEEEIAVDGRQVANDAVFQCAAQPRIPAINRRFCTTA